MKGFELRKDLAALEALHVLLGLAAEMSVLVALVDGLGHEILAASRIPTRVARLHLDLDRLEARHLMGVGHVVAVGANVQEFPHANRALVTENARCDLILVWPHRPRRLQSSWLLLLLLFTLKLKLLLLFLDTHDAFISVEVQSMLIELLFTRKSLRTTAAIEHSVCGHVGPVMFQVRVNLTGLYEQLAAASYVTDVLSLDLVTRNVEVIAGEAVQPPAMRPDRLGVQIILLVTTSHRTMVHCHHCARSKDYWFINDEVVIRAFGTSGSGYFCMDLDRVHVQFGLRVELVVALRTLEISPLGFDIGFVVSLVDFVLLLLHVKLATAFNLANEPETKKKRSILRQDRKSPFHNWENGREKIFPNFHYFSYQLARNNQTHIFLFLTLLPPLQ